MKGWIRAAAVVAVSSSMLLGFQSSGAVDYDPPWPNPWPAVETLEFPPMEWPEVPIGEDSQMPGLAQGPIFPGTNFSLNYGNTVRAMGRSEALKTKQRFNIPLSELVAALGQGTVQIMDRCDEPIPGVRGVQFIRTYQYAATAKSPEGAEHEWGIFPRFEVNSVAFGAVPAVATIELRQVRRADGIPEPLQMTTREFQSSFPSSTRPCSMPADLGGPNNFLYDQLLLKGAVEVRIVDLTVDGVAVPVGGQCATGAPAQLEFRVPNYYTPFNELRPHPLFPPAVTAELYSARLGGLLRGAIDIPSFAGCGQDENLDPLLTGLISGDGNPVEIRQEDVRPLSGVISPGFAPTFGGIFTQFTEPMDLGPDFEQQP